MRKSLLTVSELMEELRQVALEAIQSAEGRYQTDWAAIKGMIKGDLAAYLYKRETIF